MYVSYGDLEYLQHAMASVVSLRRYDTTRTVILCCEESHRKELIQKRLTHWFDEIISLEPSHRSITGFKHNVHLYMACERNLFVDSDMVWCRCPDGLWNALETYDYTITGTFPADNFFGASKGVGVVADMIMGRRQRTMRKFRLTHLPRVQSGMIYASDRATAQRVGSVATDFLQRRHETHFRSRVQEEGRSLETCEWSLAMAMATLDIPVYPWLQGHRSPQLDYIADWTQHDSDFKTVRCRYYCDQMMYSLRGVRPPRLRKLLMSFLAGYPGKGDWMDVTPYALHFGWLWEKGPFLEFSKRSWLRLTELTYA